MSLIPANVAPYRKFLVAIATALAVASPLIPGGISPQEAIAIALAALGAIGVYAVPNDQPSS